MQHRLSSILGRVRRLVAQRGDVGVNDARLLQRFAAHHDEAAFEVLVWRHGPMVLGVGRRLLKNLQDAEDVLQATFLALARQASSISKREALGAWLYKVAVRTALRTRIQQRKRSMEPLDDANEPAAPVAPAESEALAALDEELQRLPAKYRTPLLMSYLQGLTNQDIAAELGCPIGTVFTRLARGRERLRLRLVRRGITISAGMLAAVLAEAAPAATLSTQLARTTVHAVATSAAGSTAAVAPHVAAMTEGVLKMMWLGKMKLIVAVLALVVIAGSSAALVAFRAISREENDGKKAAVDDEKSQAEAQQPARESLRYGGQSFDDWRKVLLTELKPELRAEAIQAMSAFGTNGYAREAAAAILQMLRGYDPLTILSDGGDNLVVGAAQNALIKIGTDAIPALVEELTKGNRRSRLHSIGLISQIAKEPKDVVPAVKKAAESGDTEARCLALRTLSGFDSADARTAIVSSAGDKNHDVRATAIELVAEMGAKAKGALPHLLAAADEEKHPDIRIQALSALKNFDLDAAKALPVLRKAMKDESFEVRFAALGIAAKLGPQAKDVVAPIAYLLKIAEKEDQKIAIVQTIGRIGPAASTVAKELTMLLHAELERQEHPGLIDELKKTLEKIKK